MLTCTNKECSEFGKRMDPGGFKLSDHNKVFVECHVCNTLFEHVFEHRDYELIKEEVRYSTIEADEIDKDILDTIANEAEFIEEDSDFVKCEVENNFVEWDQIRDEVNTTFLTLRAICKDIKAHHTGDRLMELNREMLNMLYELYKVGD